MCLIGWGEEQGVINLSLDLGLLKGNYKKINE